MNRVYAALIALAALSCRDGCSCSGLRGEAEDGGGLGRLTIAAEPKTMLSLAIATSAWENGWLRVRADGERTAWMFGLVIDHPMDREQGRLVAPRGGGRCRARYLRDGKMSEAELDLVDVSVRELGVTHPVSGHPGATRADTTQTRVAVIATCRKRFAETTAGTPHAAALPAELSVSGEIRVR